MAVNSSDDVMEHDIPSNWESNLQHAVEGCKLGFSIRTESQVNNVPRTTLSRDMNAAKSNGKNQEGGEYQGFERLIGG